MQGGPVVRHLSKIWETLKDLPLMDKKQTKLIQRARDALLAVLANAGAKPFRRSDVVAKMLESRRNRRFGSDWVAIRKEAELAAADAVKEAASAGSIARTGHLHWVRAAGAARKTLNGTALSELAAPINLEIRTKVPGKWLFVDCETGEVYQGTSEGSLKRASVETTTAIRKAIS